MTLAIDDYVYTQDTAQPDRIGVSWVHVTRRQVQDIQGESVSLSAHVEVEYPEHSPPETVSAIDWCAPSDSVPFVTSTAVISAQYLTQPDLSGAYQFADEQAVLAARNSHRNHCYVNRESGKAKPELSATEAFEFHVLDWRHPW